MLREGQYFWWNGTVFPFIKNIGKVIKIDDKYIYTEILNQYNTNTISYSINKKTKDIVLKGIDISKNLDCSHLLLIEVHIFIKQLYQNIDDGNKTNS